MISKKFHFFTKKLLLRIFSNELHNIAAWMEKNIKRKQEDKMCSKKENGKNPINFDSTTAAAHQHTHTHAYSQI